MKKLSCLILLFCSTYAAFAQGSARSIDFISGIGRRGLINERKAILRSTTTLYFNQPIHPIIDLKLGLDAIYFENTDVNILKGWSRDHWAYGLVVGTDIKLNKIYFHCGMARYLYFKSVYNETHPKDPIRYYTKMGFRYQFLPHWSIGFTMRAHRTQADYIDFNLGWRFWSKRAKLP